MGSTPVGIDMTTVIFQNGRLYADTQVTNTTVSEDGQEAMNYIWRDSKLHRMADRIFATSGCMDSIREFFDWTVAGRPCRFLRPKILSRRGQSTVIEYSADGLIGWNYRQLGVTWRGRFTGFTWWKPVRWSPHARLWMGSGADYAREALDLGLNPYEAICYAADRDPFTNDLIQTLSLDDLGKDLEPDPDPWFGKDPAIIARNS